MHGAGILRLAALAVAMVVTVYYAERLLYGTPAVWAIVLSARARGGGARRGARCSAASAPAGLLGAGALLAALVAVLTVGVKSDLTAIKDKVSDAGFVGQLAGDVERPMSAYLRAHRDGAKYEVAAESATQIGSLIVKDALPIAVLTTYNARVYTTVAQARTDDRRGPGALRLPEHLLHAQSVERERGLREARAWIREHGTDVSRAAGLPRGGLLYLLPGAKP